jgi:hypothetical protein
VVIRIRISKKNRQNNGQKKKYKRTRRVWRYQRGNQNPYIEEEQTKQWPKEKVQKDKKSLKYQRGNQNPYIEEEQTTQWSKEKVQKDKQRSTQHTHKSKDRVTRTPLKTGGELRCSTSGTRRVNLVTSLVISHSYCSMWYTCMTNWNVYSNCLFLLVTFVFFWPLNFQGVEICILCFSKLHQILYCVFVCLFV